MSLFNAPGGTGRTGKDGQDLAPLISGLTIKTINGESVLGFGNISLAEYSLGIFTSTAVLNMRLIQSEIPLVTSLGVTTGVQTLASRRVVLSNSTGAYLTIALLG